MSFYRCGGGGKKYNPVTQVICASRGGTTTYTVIAETAHVEYKLTASTEGGWIRVNGALIKSVSGSVGAYNTVSGEMDLLQGDIITVQSQGGSGGLSTNYVKITEEFS